jgi:GH15 family glucan-1,4-alpha-glucosidase
MITPATLDLAVVGNSTVAALIDRSGTVVWGCWPRFDGVPVFSALLGGDAPAHGFFSIGFDEIAHCEQTYERNTAVVRTVITAPDGAAIAITDFAPRFAQFGRTYRPPMFVRIVEPIAGVPLIRIRLRPGDGRGGPAERRVAGSNHVRWIDDTAAIRLTTDASINHVVGENRFVLKRPLTFVLHPDETLGDSATRIGADFLERTRSHWRDWVRALNLPYEWQPAVIRAAITLQLCAFEDTGAIVAALTTSIPEAPGTERTWDYRFCWIRDAFFTVHALNRVGATPTMERFIDYVTDIIAIEGGPGLKPLYPVVPENPADEEILPGLAGYRGQGPVRIGNAAREQVQHDVWGSVVLAAWQMFFDERLPKKGDVALYRLLEPLGQAALAHALEPDAGIWEYRHRTSVHTFSAAMCWVAADRLAGIAATLGLDAESAEWRTAADALREIVLDRAWNPAGFFAGTLDGDDLDASVLVLHEIGIVSATDPRFRATVDTIGERLAHDGHVRRYAAADDFGVPAVAFTICTFWYVDALAASGRTEEARRLFEDLLTRRNHVGLLSEDLDPTTGELWGNFPQTYSMSGLIVAAMRLSKGWETTR